MAPSPGVGAVGRRRTADGGEAATWGSPQRPTSGRKINKQRSAGALASPAEEDVVRLPRPLYLALVESTLVLPSQLLTALSIDRQLTNFVRVFIYATAFSPLKLAVNARCLRAKD